MPFILSINGQGRDFANLTQPASLKQVIAELSLKGDRVAVEHNGSIVQRAQWPHTAVAPGDRLEIVHFVGGGADEGRGAIAPERPTPPRDRRQATIHNIRYRT